MTTVTGKLTRVTSEPSAVTQVWVRAADDRVAGADVVLSERGLVPVNNGTVTMNLKPGLAVMVLSHHNRTTKSIPLYVAPSGTQTLGNAVQQAQTLSGKDATALQQMMDQISAQVASVTSTTRWSGDRLVVNGKTSPPLTGPQGPPGEVTMADFRPVRDAVNKLIKSPVEMIDGPVSLDSFTTTGVWHQNLNEDAAGDSYPARAAGLLEVHAIGYWTHQRYTTINGDVYIRRAAGGTWGPWRKILTE